ncbi:hypothetical protein KM043_014604 [Ampulex compressa]|nr:hypothetical protein KM043_014604 [Ampulex compressa]
MAREVKARLTAPKAAVSSDAWQYSRDERPGSNPGCLDAAPDLDARRRRGDYNRAAKDRGDGLGVSLGGESSDPSGTKKLSDGIEAYT